MTEIILHIGAHKTGTTALQNVLANSKDYLDKFGAIYPNISWYHFAQHRIAFALKGLTDPAKNDQPDVHFELEGLRSVIKKNDGKKIIISSEELFSISLDNIKILKSYLRGVRVKIVAFLRAPEDMLLSIYNQKAKTPNNGFFRNIHHFIDNPRLIDHDISYGVQIGKWMEVFGSESVCVFTHEGGDVIDRFFKILGMEKPQISAKLENKSISAPALEIMRIAKMKNIKHNLQRELYEILITHYNNAPKLRMSHSQKLKVRRAFDAEYDALFTVLGRENPYSSAQLEARESDEIIAPTLTFSDLTSLVFYLLEQQGARKPVFNFG